MQDKVSPLIVKSIAFEPLSRELYEFDQQAI